MKTKFKTIAGILLRVLLLVVVVETIFYFMTPPQFKDIGYLINFKQVHKPVAEPGFGFDEIDPLLGYEKTPATLAAHGFKLESNCILLTTTEDTAGCYNILITGGSTSDITLYPNNWPVEFCALLKQRGIKAKLYCAGVGGYSSGQELLKLMRDGLDTGPWLHISYSGANEFFDASYVSIFEQGFYETEFEKGPSSWLLPNTVMFMRDMFRVNHPGLRLRPNVVMPSAEFWKKNMRLMHGIAVENKYRFIGFLQPVLGSGKFDQPMPGHEDAVARYKQGYPALRQACKAEYLIDLSAAFDTCKGNVFMDNCHIHDAFQQVVATNILWALEEKGVFEK